MKISKKELLERLDMISNAFIQGEGVYWTGELITDEKMLRNKVKGLLHGTKKIDPRDNTVMIHPKLSIKVWDDIFEKAKAKQTVTIPVSEYNKLLQSANENTYKITKEDKDLLIEIENVLTQKSKAIWGLTRKRKIKGGGDITPYETGYDKLYDYIELVARIIG